MLAGHPLDGGILILQSEGSFAAFDARNRIGGRSPHHGGSLEDFGKDGSFPLDIGSQ